MATFSHSRQEINSSMLLSRPRISSPLCPSHSRNNRSSSVPNQSMRPVFSLLSKKHSSEVSVASHRPHLWFPISTTWACRPRMECNKTSPQGIISWLGQCPPANRSSTRLNHPSCGSQWYPAPSKHKARTSPCQRDQQSNLIPGSSRSLTFKL